MTLTLTLSDVIEGLEDVIEEWGDEAKGGDRFALTVDDAKPTYNEWGIAVYPTLPVCLVATFAADHVNERFDTLALEQSGPGLTKDARQFLSSVINAVDDEPNRDWRIALDKVLAKWGLA